MRHEINTGLSACGRGLAYCMAFLVMVYVIPCSATPSDNTLPLRTGQGNAENTRGFNYENGEGVPQDYAEAVKWYRIAADRGFAVAQVNLGFMYANGRGVHQDHAEALKWYRKAADHGDASGEYNLGYMYGAGQGASPNYGEALKWFRKAADQGFGDAQYGLGTMYRDGAGMRQDYVEAYKWYSLAALHFPASETETRDRAVSNRERLAAKMTAAQVAQAEKLVHEWKSSLSLLAEQGNAEAQNELGSSYDNGQGVPQNYGEALKWYRKAAEQGNASAEYNLGSMYRDGQGVSRDYGEALKWFRKAADHGRADAANNLGGMYDNGQGVPKDDAEALKWYRKAADQGYAEALQNLAICYATGQGVPQDIVQAYKWLSLAVAAFPASEAEQRAKAIKVRDLVATRLTPAQITEAQKLVHEWRPGMTRDSGEIDTDPHYLIGNHFPTNGGLIPYFKWIWAR